MHLFIVVGNDSTLGPQYTERFSEAVVNIIITHASEGNRVYFRTVPISDSSVISH